MNFFLSRNCNSEIQICLSHKIFKIETNVFDGGRVLLSFQGLRWFAQILRWQTSSIWWLMESTYNDGCLSGSQYSEDIYKILGLVAKPILGGKILKYKNTYGITSLVIIHEDINVKSSTPVSSTAFNSSYIYWLFENIKRFSGHQQIFSSSCTHRRCKIISKWKQLGLSAWFGIIFLHMIPCITL